MVIITWWNSNILSWMDLEQSLKEREKKEAELYENLRKLSPEEKKKILN